MTRTEYKTITQESYQATAKEFTQNVADLAPIESINRFVAYLPSGGKILDIGCGSGRDSKIFCDKGFQTVGIDFSSNLLEIAKKKAPGAEFHLMDIEKLQFPPASFDGAWACHSLLHIPKKGLPAVLQAIHALLKEKGTFYLTFKKGLGEVLEKDLRYGDYEKFWSYYDEEELKQLLESAHFTLLSFELVETHHAYQTHPAFRIYCQKS